MANGISFSSDMAYFTVSQFPKETVIVIIANVHDASRFRHSCGIAHLVASQSNDDLIALVLLQLLIW